LKILNFLLLALSLSSCLTIYKINSYRNTEYIIKKGNKFETFFYEGKDTCSSYYLDFLQENESIEWKKWAYTHSNFTVELNDSFIIYNYRGVFSYIDTFFLKNNLLQKKESILEPFSYQLQLLATSNGRPVIGGPCGGRTFTLRYKKDSVHYFNNQIPVKHMFSNIMWTIDPKKMILF